MQEKHTWKSHGCDLLGSNQTVDESSPGVQHARTHCRAAEAHQATSEQSLSPPVITSH